MGLMLRRQHPAHEGRFLEAILKAERDVASTAAGNRGHEKPGTAARQNAWWRGAFAPDPATGTEAGPGPTTPRRSAVRRASRLRGRAHASQAWRRALLRDTYKAGRLWALRQSPRSGGRQRRRREEEGRKPGGKNAPGMKKTALFDIVNRKRRDAMHRQRAGTRHRVAGNALGPGRGRACARPRYPPRSRRSSSARTAGAISL